jgi:ComF family protein
MRRNLSILRSALAQGVAAAAARILPQDCLLCGATAGARVLCDGCSAELQQLPAQRCPVCALPTPGAAVCGSCLKSPPRFDATAAVFVYAFPMDRMVQALKYGHRLAVAPFLGEALAACGGVAADLIVPVPLHPRRLRERGFNQALEIARVLAKRWDRPLDFASCERSHDTAPQASLPWEARRRTVRGGFLCRSDLSGRRVVAVDDVMTTGATLDEFARCLKNAGAAHVTNLVVARTLR